MARGDVRRAIGRLLPEGLKRRVRKHRYRRQEREFAALTPQQAFEKVYRDRIWGGSDADPFCSGSGSRDAAKVDAYVAAVRRFLQDLGGTPDVADLGCGDFNVGARIRPLCGRYVAGDIVPALIERNRARFADADVDFRVIDLIEGELPRADILFVRQVLQHLSNAHIARFLRRIEGRYDWLVLTEHQSDDRRFRANIDKPAGPTTRLYADPPSGVVVTAPPFDLRALEARELCAVHEDGGTIRTVAYRLRAA